MKATSEVSDVLSVAKIFGSETVRVLVVDDEVDALQELADTLVNYGFEPITAFDFRSAMQAFLLDDSIGVVLADVHMPVNDGLSLAKSIRSSGDRGGACQIVFITGHPALSTAIEAIKTKGTGYLTKPVDPIELSTVVQTAIDQYREARKGRLEKVAFLEVINRLLQAREQFNSAISIESSGSTNQSVGSRRVAQVESLLKIRDMRGAYLPKEIFGDPAWFMILDLYLSGLQNKKVSVSSLCFASGGSQTTALRRVHDLVDLGVVIREQDPTDRRRAYLVLSNDAILHLEEMLDRLHDATISTSRAQKLTASNET